jgi:hypothetical protein
MTKVVVEQLKTLKHGVVAPRAEWKAQNRAMLLSQIKNALPEKNHSRLTEKLWGAFAIFLPQSVVLGLVRPLAMFVVVALVAPSLYYGTVLASQESLPGEGMYSAKRYTEKIQTTVVSLIGNQQAQTQLHITFALRRANETNKIIITNDPKQMAEASNTVADLKNEINSISTSLEESSAVAVNDIKKNTEQITGVLQDAKNNLLIAGNSSTKALADEVKATKDLSQDVSFKAVATLVTKHLEGDLSVSKADVQAALSSAVQNSVDAVVVSQQNVDGAKTILENAKTEVKDLSADNKQSLALASSTKVLGDSLTNAASQTQVAAEHSDAVTLDVVKKAGEAQLLVGSDNLTQAVDKIKELNLVSKEMEKISDTTIEKTQNVLPMVDAFRGTVAGDTTSTPSVITTSTSGMLQLFTTSTFTVSGTPGQIVSTSSVNSTSTVVTTTKVITTTKK